MTLRIDLLGHPPSREELDSILRIAQAGFDQNCRQRRRLRLAAVAALPILAFATFAMLHANWAWLPIILMVVACMVATAPYHNVRGELDACESNLRPIDATTAAHVLEACELDPRVDQYRQAVVSQGRELTELEGAAFQKWHRYGFEESVRMSRVRSSKPVCDPRPALDEFREPNALAALVDLAERLDEFGLDNCDEAAELVYLATSHEEPLDLPAAHALFNAVGSLVRGARAQDFRAQFTLPLEALEAELNAKVLRVRLAMASERDDGSPSGLSPVAG